MKIVLKDISCIPLIKVSFDNIDECAHVKQHVKINKKNRRLVSKQNVFMRRIKYIFNANDYNFSIYMWEETTRKLFLKLYRELRVNNFILKHRCVWVRETNVEIDRKNRRLVSKQNAFIRRIKYNFSVNDKNFSMYITEETVIFFKVISLQTFP